MAYQPKQTPEQIEAAKAARKAKDIADARAVAITANTLADYLAGNGAEWTEGAQYRLFRLCNAIIDLIDDGDCMAQREIIMDDLHIDEDGNAVRAVAA